MRRRPLCVSVLLFVLASASSLAGSAQDASARAAGTRNAVVGRVVDKAGRPVAGVFVTLLQEHDTFYGNRRVSIASARVGSTTDERGEYRLENLNLGPYYVVASPHNAPLAPDGRVNRSGHGITYYPGVANRDAAKLVIVTINGPVSADIPLVPATLAVVSGTVIGSDNQPVRGGTLAIAHGDGMFGVDGKGFRIRPDGSFLLAAIPPGTYFLQFRESPWPPPRGETPLVSGAKVVVDGRDIAGARVAPIHMVRGTGRVIVDRAAKPPLLPSDIHVSGFPVVIDGNPGPQRGGDVKNDLTFEFATWPGPAYVRVTIDSPGWKVKAIRYQGVDVTDAGIDFKEGQEISGIEVELVKASGRGPG